MTARAYNRPPLRGVLVIHPGALGDVLLARPVLRALRCQFPQHEIALISANAVGSLLCYSAEVDRAFSLEEKYLSQLFAGFESLSSSFRTWLGQCELVVGWLRDADGAVTNTLRLAGVQQIQLETPFSSALATTHQADRYWEAVGMEGQREDFTSTLKLPAELERQGQEVLQAYDWDGSSPLILVHPGSGSHNKCMDAWRLAKVIEWLIEARMAPMLLEGPADCRAVAQVLSSLTVPVPVIRELSLSVVAGVMSQAKLYLGHDSGMTHLAAALAVPTIACFGPTHASRWSPQGRAVAVISGMPCVCSDWSKVETCHDKVCLHIPVESLIEACRSQLLRLS